MKVLRCALISHFQVLVTAKYYLIHVQRYGMYFIANVQHEVCDQIQRHFPHCLIDADAALFQVTPLLVTEFLHRVVDVFRDYFNEVFIFFLAVLLVRIDSTPQVSEESIKENFITVYQLMDEMMDNGIPMTTEPNVLKVREDSEYLHMMTVVISFCK